MSECIVGKINQHFQGASDRVWQGTQRVKFRHKNFSILENKVGILSKLCDCGYETKGFIELTNPHCPCCKERYER